MLTDVDLTRSARPGYGGNASVRRQIATTIVLLPTFLTRSLRLRDRDQVYGLGWLRGE